MKKLFTVALILMMLVCGFAHAEDTSISYIQEKGTFILGLDDSCPPMGFRDENNDIVGFDIDVAKKVAEKLGVEFVAQPIAWDAKELELNSKNIDCIWNGMSITPERQESMAMTFPYLNNGVAFYVRAEDNIATLEDLAGKKVAVQGGSLADDLLAGDYAELAGTFDEVISFEEYLSALMDLQNGGCDAVLIDVFVAEERIKGMETASIKCGPVLADDLYGVGFRKADLALRDKVQEILIEMKADGSLGEIAKKWFSEDITIVPAE